MRLIVSVLLLCSFVKAGATNYYFSTVSGDDSRNPAAAQNPSTPWKTINKFNSIFSSLSPGDAVFFQKGEVYSGTLNISRSGAAGLPIVIGAYGSGAKPIINGLKTITNWIPVTENIYESDLSALSGSLNMVLINGALQPIGRWPKVDAANNGYLTISSTDNTSISSNDISGAPSFVGGELVMRKYQWILDRAGITAQSATTIDYSSYTAPGHPGFTYDAIKGHGFFIQNHVNTLTTFGDWCYDVAAKKIKVFFGGVNPSGVKIEASVIENLVEIASQNYINFEGIAFTGANSNAFEISSSNNIGIVNCDIDFSGINAVNVSNPPQLPYPFSGNILVSGCTIRNTNNNAIDANRSTNCTIQNNIIRNTGMIRGMGLSGDAQYNAIQYVASNSIVEHNNITNTGYIGIHFIGDNTVIRNNVVDSFCLIKSDGGGIYTYGLTGTGRKITGNIVSNGIGDLHGINAELNNPYAGQVHGIYMDGNSNDVTIDSNTCFSNSHSGIWFGGSCINMNVSNNLLYNNTVAQIKGIDNLNNINIKNNILFARDSAQLVLVLLTGGSYSIGAVDSNYYCRPLYEPNEIDTGGYPNSPTFFNYPAGGIVQAYNGKFYSLDRWQALTKQDVHTVKTSVSLKDLKDLRFEYNPTNTAKTVNLNGHYYDLKSNTVYSSITLAPYSSAILIKSDAVAAQVIDFPPLPSMHLGDAPYTVNATASSGLPVIFTVVSGPAILTGDALTVSGTGTAVIEASQPGNFDYSPATPVKQSLAVLKGAQDISFTSVPAKTFGDQPFALTATASSGLPVSFRLVSGPATLTDNIVTLTGVGTVLLEASQTGNNNYEPAAPVLQSFDVSTAVAPLTECSATGSILLEQWNNIFGTDVSSIPVQTTPTTTGALGSLETRNTGDWMGSRIRGFICPPMSGNYTFYISGDDAVELWLSTNNSPATKIKVASSTDWTSFREWNKYPSQKSAAISLQAGKSYYIEVLHKNGGGGDNVSVKWDMPNGETEVPVSASHLSPYLTTGVQQQEINFGAISTKTFGEASFTLEATSSSGLKVNFEIVSGPATLTGNVVTLTGAGTVVVKALQQGNAGYTPATPVIQSFIVALPPVCSATGSILREQWNDVFGTAVSSIPLLIRPSGIGLLGMLETRNTGDWMGARIRGYICPPMSGNYTFYIAGDDAVELWLSIDDDPDNKIKIAGSTDWTSFREWGKYPSQKSALVNLVSGRRYYIEVLHKNGGGGDNVSVRWDLPNGVTEIPIAGSHLSPYSLSNTQEDNSLVYKEQMSNKVQADVAPAKNMFEAATVISAYPNPFTTTTTIQVNPAESGEALLNLYDIQGRLSKSLYKGVLESGASKHFSLSSYSLSSGIYVIRLITKTKTVSQKIVVVK